MAEQIQLAEFDLDMQGVIDEAQKYKKILDDLKQAQKELRKDGQSSSKQYIENEANIKTLNKEYRERIKVLDASNDKTIKAQNAAQKLEAALSTEATTINELRANNKELNAIRNNTNIETTEGIQQLADLNKKLDDNNAAIKENVDAIGKQRLNVGNYTKSILDAYQALEDQGQELEQNALELKQAREETEKGSKEWKAYSKALVKVETDLEGVQQELDQTNEETGESVELTDLAEGGFFGLATAAAEAGGAGALMAAGFQSARVAIIGATKASLRFIASPFGLILAAITGAVLLVANAMNRNEESANKLAQAFAPLSGLLDALLSALEPVGDFILDVLVGAFDLLVMGVQQTIVALSEVLEWAGFEEAAASTRDFAKEMMAAAKAGGELVKAEQELVKMERELGVLRSQAEEDAEKLRSIRDDESKSIRERMEANINLGKVLAQQQEDELAVAQQALLVANKNIEANGRGTAELDAQAAAKERINEIQGRIVEQQAEQIQNEFQLREEAETLATEKRQAAIDQMNAQLDLFLAEQGFRKKSAEQEINLARQTSAQKIEILKAELANKTISETEYLAQKKQIENELALQEAELTAANAEVELQQFRENIEKKIQAEGYLSEQVLQEKLDLNTRLLEQEKEHQKLLFEQGLITKAEQDAAIKALEEANRLSNEELRIEREATAREEELALRALRFEEDIELMRSEKATRFEIEQEIVSQQAKKELDALNQQLNNKLISERLYAKKSKKITKDKEDAIADIEKGKRRAKIRAVGETLGVIVSLIDENSAAGKAVAVSQALISTYLGIARGVELGFPAAIPAVAAAAATGFKAVKDILATEIPSASGTGSVRGGTGEAQSKTPTFSSGFRIEGQDRNLSGSESATVQSQLEANGLINEMANKVGQAVERGSREGSSEGITNLSDNRDIQRSSSF